MPDWQVSFVASCAAEYGEVARLVMRVEKKDVCWRSVLSCRSLVGWLRVGGEVWEGEWSELRRRDCFARYYASNGGESMARSCRVAGRA